MKKIKVLVVGCGRMGRIGTRYLYNKGLDIVGAIDANPALDGIDLGTHAGLDVELGVKISNDIDKVLASTDAKVAICAMFSTMIENEPVFNKLLEHGINIITTCDESHYCWNTAPEVTKRLDELAKKNNCSLIGCGFQDVFWLHIVDTVAGGVNEIKTIKGLVINNSDDYGPVLGKQYKVGLTVEEFNAAIKEEMASGDVGAITRATNEALCASFHLTPTGHSVEVVPYVKDHDVYSKTMECLIPAGNSVGTTERVTTTTAEGITIINDYNIFVYDEKCGECDLTTWYLKGEPNVDLELPRGLTAPLTMSTLVNRIPDAIKATPGYHPNADLPAAKYYTTPEDMVKALEA